MPQPGASPVDPKRLELYLSEYYARTDLVYRFGLLLSSSREGAERLTEETFKELSLDFNRVQESSNAASLLLALAWKTWGTIKSQTFRPGSSPLISYTQKLSQDERAAFYVVEMAGLEVAEAAKIFSVSEDRLRQSLAVVYRHFATTELKI